MPVDPLENTLSKFIKDTTLPQNIKDSVLAQVFASHDGKSNIEFFDDKVRVKEKDPEPPKKEVASSSTPLQLPPPKTGSQEPIPPLFRDLHEGNTHDAQSSDPRPDPTSARTAPISSSLVSSAEEWTVNHRPLGTSKNPDDYPIWQDKMCEAIVETGKIADLVRLYPKMAVKTITIPTMPGYAAITIYRTREVLDKYEVNSDPPFDV